MVTFVSFNDSTALADTLSVTAAKISGMDILMNVDIANEVKMAVNLSADGKNRIDLKGGGNLTYTMNTLGDRKIRIDWGYSQIQSTDHFRKVIQYTTRQLCFMEWRYSRPQYEYHSNRASEDFSHRK